MRNSDPALSEPGRFAEEDDPQTIQRKAYREPCAVCQRDTDRYNGAYDAMLCDAECDQHYDVLQRVMRWAFESEDAA